MPCCCICNASAKRELSNSMTALPNSCRAWPKNGTASRNLANNFACFGSPSAPCLFSVELDCDSACAKPAFKPWCNSSVRSSKLCCASVKKSSVNHAGTSFFPCSSIPPLAAATLIPVCCISSIPSANKTSILVTGSSKRSRPLFNAVNAAAARRYALSTCKVRMRRRACPIFS